jgi:hypothetical protein
MAPSCRKYRSPGDLVRGEPSAAAVALSVLVLLAPTDARAQARAEACGLSPPSATPGVIWQGREPLGLREIAGLLAPVLWLSADEPLLAEGQPPIPAAHPCDAAADRAVVYYQITELTYHGDTPVARPEEDDAAFADKVESFILKYYFYYPEDSGVGGHIHDLETAEFEVWLEGDGDCRRVRLASVEALAHGSRWYSNTLKVRSDMKYPVTLFVEEGKHATAPDRNADGAFMRGYDVTERVNDAWGVRDSLGHGVLLSSGYASEMTKPRREAFRVLPPESPYLQVTARRRSYKDEEPSLGRYELRPANRVRACEAIARRGERLIEMMADHRFGLHELPTQYKADSVNRALSELGLPDSWLSVSLRVSDRRPGAAMIFKGLDLREGWIVPRVTVSGKEATAELLFTPSASRWADTYLSGGVRRQFVTTRERRTIDTELGRQEIDVVIPPSWRIAVETGIKIRARLPAKLRPFVLGYTFGGMRFGLQAIGFRQVDQCRFIWEIGAGAW